MDLHSRKDIMHLVLTTFKSTIWFVVRTCMLGYPMHAICTQLVKQVVYCSDNTISECISRKSHNEIIVSTQHMMVVHTSIHSY